MKNYLAVALLVFVSLTAFAQKSGFTLDAIYDVKGVGAPAASPGGKYLAFTVTEYTLRGGKSKTTIYLYDAVAKQSRKLDLGEKSVSSPFWHRDDLKLYYTKAVDGANQVFAYTLQSGATEQITNFYSGVSSVQFSPDGKYLAFSADVYPQCGADQNCNKTLAEGAESGPIQAHLADELLFRHWTSYWEGKRSRIFLMDLTEKDIKDITPFTYNCPVFSLGGTGFTFSPDGKRICYVANPEESKANSTNTDLWIYDIAAGTTTNITAANKAADADPVFSPDGAFIAYKAQAQAGYESDRWRIMLYDAAKKESKELTATFDNWVNDFAWNNDGSKIFFTGEVKAYTPLYKLDVKSRAITKISPDRAIGGFVYDAASANVYYVSRLMDKPADMYKLNTSTGAEEQITFFNKDITEKFDFRKPEHLWIKGAGGKPVHVLLVTPHGFDPKKKYPLIVNVHGGPQSQWMDAYRPDAQLYSGYGYIVAFPNPHGSTGYGQDYTAAISGDWGGKVYEDVMAVTEGLAKLPYVDKDRIGAMGWSYGGYMMNWLQGHTKRFKCFVSMMGLYNVESFYGTTEELWFPEWDMKGTPWDNKALYDKFSPSRYVKNFSTPTLIITGERDYRVSYTQSLEYFTALKKRGVDSRIIVFKNDGHWPSHIKSMPLYYNAHLEWFHKYLGGASAPYDSKKMVTNTAYEK